MSSYDFPRYISLPINIPVFVIISKEDIAVNHELNLTDCSNSTVMEHNKGHIIFQNKTFINSVVKWIKDN